MAVDEFQNVNSQNTSNVTDIRTLDYVDDVKVTVSALPDPRPSCSCKRDLHESIFAPRTSKVNSTV